MSSSLALLHWSEPNTVTKVHEHISTNEDYIAGNLGFSGGGWIAACPIIHIEGKPYYNARHAKNYSKPCLLHSMISPAFHLCVCIYIGIHNFRELNACFDFKKYDCSWVAELGARVRSFTNEIKTCMLIPRSHEFHLFNTGRVELIRDKMSPK